MVTTFLSLTYSDVSFIVFAFFLLRLELNWELSTYFPPFNYSRSIEHNYIVAHGKRSRCGVPPSLSRGTKSFRKFWFESTRPVKFIRFKYLWDGRARATRGRGTGPGSIWWRREKMTSILYSREERDATAVAASFSSEKFPSHELREETTTPKTNGEFNWPDRVPRIGSLARRRAKQPATAGLIA